MSKRDVVRLSPAFPVADVSASLVLREDGKEPVEVGVSVLNVKAGDTLVLRSASPMPADRVEYIGKQIELIFPGVKAMVLDGDLELSGVLRQG